MGNLVSLRREDAKKPNKTNEKETAGESRKTGGKCSRGWKTRLRTSVPRTEHLISALRLHPGRTSSLLPDSSTRMYLCCAADRSDDQCGGSQREVPLGCFCLLQSDRFSRKHPDGVQGGKKRKCCTLPGAESQPVLNLLPQKLTSELCKERNKLTLEDPIQSRGRLIKFSQMFCCDKRTALLKSVYLCLEPLLL